MIKRLRCFLFGHMWKPYTMLGRLGNYPIDVCVYCSKWTARHSHQADGSKS